MLYLLLVQLGAHGDTMYNFVTRISCLVCLEGNEYFITGTYKLKKLRVLFRKIDFYYINSKECRG